MNRIMGVGGKSLIRRNVIVTFGRQILAAVAQFLIVVVIARQLGPEGNGQYAMAILLPTLLASFLNLGVGPATVYHVGRSEFTARRAFQENILLGGWIGSGGVAIAVPVLVFWGDVLFPQIPHALLVVGVIAFPVSLLLGYLSTILQGMEDFRAYNLTILLPPYVSLVGVIVSLYALEAGALGALVAYLIGQGAGLSLVLVLLSLRTRSEAVEVTAPGRRHYRTKTLGYGWKAHLSNVLTFVNYRADIFLVNLFLNPAATGLYVVAVQIAEKLWMVSQAAATVLLPRLSAMHQDPTARLALTQKAFFIVSGLTAVASAGTAIAVVWLIGPVFGEEFEKALPAFLWLIPGIIAGAGARIQANCIAAAGKPEWNMVLVMVVLTLNILGNILLIPNFGIVGAAWSTSFSYIVIAIVEWWLIKKLPD